MRQGHLVVQIIGTKKCKDTSKALRYFQERGIKPAFLDLNEKPLSKGELENITRVVNIEDLLDKTSKEYEKQNLKYMQFNIFEKLLEFPLLLKTPILRYGKKVILGYAPEKFSEIVKDIKG
ncbi:MAG: ArsC family transcriptional regulator [Leptospiraceae bacterium]|nr:ArsC family transcriptional regulator [Leptospiraceae bacterium]